MSQCGQRASFNGASGKRCDIDGMTRTGELAGVSESSRRIDGQAAEGRGAEPGKRSIITQAFLNLLLKHPS